MSNKDTERAVALGESEMERRLANLRMTSFQELAELPDYETVNLAAGRREVKVTTYRDRHAHDKLQIVVQWCVGLRLGFNHVGADGFTISMDGIVQSMEEQDLYEFT